MMVINASAAATLLEQRPENNSGSEWDSNPRPLRCQCSALLVFKLQTILSLKSYIISLLLGDE